MRRTAFRSICAILLLAVLVVIYVFSSQPAKKSSSVSNSVAVTLYEDAPQVLKPSTQQEKETQKKQLIKNIRKYAHFLLYAALGFSAFLFMLTFKKPCFAFKIIISSVFCIAVSFLDEIHQIFVEGRGFEMDDIALDCEGAVFAVFALAVLVVMVKRITETIKERKRLR